MIIIISLYICVLLIMIGIILFAKDKNCEKSNELRADVVFYLRGESEEIEKKLSLFFSQSIWYDIAYVDKIYLVNCENIETTTEICNKYAKKYKNVIVCDD